MRSKPKKILLYFVLFHCLCCFFPGLGQSSSDVNFSSWKIENGLPNNNINDIDKDNLGFLWIATHDGLCRYDGNNTVKVYKQTGEDKPAPNTLQSNNIRALHADSKGYLWIGTRFGGLSRFYPPEEEWVTFRHDPQQENSLSHDEVLTIFEDSKQRIWIGTENGLNLFDPATATFERYNLTLDGGIRSRGRAILCLLEDKNGWIWVGTWAGGLHLILEDDNGVISPEHVRHFQPSTLRAGNNIWKLYQDKEDRYWVGTHGGGLFLMTLPEEASNFKENQNWQPSFRRYFKDNPEGFNLKSNAIQTILQDQFLNLWVGTTHGLYKISHELLPPSDSLKKVNRNHFNTFLSASFDATSLAGNNILDLFEDDQGMIWIATSDGLSQYNWYSNQFKNFNFLNKDLQLPFTPSFLIDSTDHIWVNGIDLGLSRFQLKKNELIKLPESISPLILGNQISTIYTPDKQWLYVGTEQGITAVHIYNRKTIYYPKPKSVNTITQELYIKTILLDCNGFIWFGTNVGLFRIHPETKEYTPFFPESNPSNNISDQAINHIIQDSKGVIWVATYNGLNSIPNPEEDQVKFESYLFNLDHPQEGPMSNQIVSLKEIDGYLYIATISGICRFNYSTNKFETFEASKYRYWIRGIEQGEQGDIWMCAIEGIIHYDPKLDKVKLYDKKDGLKNTSFQLGNSAKDKENNIYFAYVDGFTYFSPDSLKRNNIPPSVYLTEIEIMNREGTRFFEGIFKDQIELDYKDYRISINIAALNYNRADKNEYAFRLVGLEENWRHGKFGTPIVYTNLKPQTYQLEVRASNNEGIWNNEGNAITIIQHPPFWSTWWFRSLTILFVGSIIFLGFLWYTNTIRQRNETLKAYNKSLSKEINRRKKVEQQLNDYNNELKRSNKDLEQFAYIASHDLKEPLRVIGSFSGLLARRYADKLDEDALEYFGFIEDGVQRMSNVINSLLTYSTVGRKNTIYETIDLKSLIKEKVSDLSQLVKEKNALIEIGNLPSIIGHKEQIGMVFFNLINNAIKFNKQLQPKVTIKEEKGDPGYWMFCVKDNGIGIDESYQEKIFGLFKRLHGKREYEGTGIGLSICQKIILRHKGVIWFESKPGNGTTFFFTIKKNLAFPSRLEEKEKGVVS